jgi:hypothetical protein
MTEPAVMLDALALDCEKTALASRGYSRRYYFASYTLMVLSLVGSIGAAVLAFVGEVDRNVVGIVALLPAICASVAGQLRMIEKGNWHFRRKHALERLARDFRLTAAQNPDWEAVESANKVFSELEERFEGDWGTALAFRFQSGELPGGAKTP